MAATSPNPAQGPPQLPAQGFIIDFNLVPGKAGDAPTILLHAACRVPGEFIRNYGGQLQQAAFIGAIDRKTGAAFVADGSPAHGLPLDMNRVVNRPPPSKNAPDIVSGEATFAIDLPRQLGLPAEGGEFAVAVWIDSIISAVKVVKVPANPALKPQRAVTARPAALSVVEFGKKNSSPKPVSGAIVAAGSFEEKPFGIGHVYGAVGPGVYPKDAKLLFVTVFASSFLSREVAAQSVVLPADAKPETGVFLDFEAGQMFTGIQDRRKAFAFIVADVQASPVVVLEPKR